MARPSATASTGTVRRSRSGWSLAAALLAGCGQPDSPPSPPPEAVQAALNLAQADLAAVPARPADRLAPLAEAELPPRFREKPACRLFRSGQLIVAAAADGAVARVDGRVQIIPKAGPVSHYVSIWAGLFRKCPPSVGFVHSQLFFEGRR
jgi:hypothetical protein